MTGPDAAAERDHYRAALERIANQGLGNYDRERKQMMGATGEPWRHWATLAHEALALRQEELSK